MAAFSASLKMESGIDIAVFILKSITYIIPSVKRNICHQGRTASNPTAPSHPPACGITAPGSSKLFAYEEGVRANRREARELIQRVTKLPIENFELMQRNEGSAFGEALSGMINQENILLASQAVELIKRYPDSFSSTEYFAVALALSQSNIKDNVPYLFENAVKRAKNYNDYNASTRAYAIYQFTQGDYLEGRKLFEMALAVWNKYPEKNPFVVNSVDLVTLMYWSNAELSINNYSEATDLIKRANDSLTKLPPDPITASLARQIADVERRIEQPHSGGPRQLGR